MTATHYERLSALDASFLSIEDRNAHMHVGSVGLLDAVPFQTKGGGLDFARIEQTVMRILPMHPRLRQKVWWPAGGPPVWVDDPQFDVSYHLHRMALPSPGTTHELKQFVGNVLSLRLDPTRPLWEAWIVEGVDGKRFAIVWKLHHSLADGISVREILFGYLGFAPSSEVAQLPPFEPRPAPSVSRLHMDSALLRVEKSREVSNRLQEFLKGAALRSAIAEAASGFVQTSANLLSDIDATPLNGEIGPHRRCDWTTCQLGTFQEIRKESGAKINDVVLAAVCAAIRRFLLAKKVAVDELKFRVMIPVSTRAEDRDRPEGNRVSNMMIPLPLFETDPRRRLQWIVDATTRAKASGQSWMGELLLQAIDWAGVHVPAALARLAVQQLPANLVVTNVRGPDVPQYLLEGQLLDSFPIVPLPTGHGLGVAIYSYNGVLHWGFNADRELLPDLHEFVRAVDIEVEQLHHAHTPIAVRGRAALRAVPAASAPAKAARNRERIKQAK